MSSSHRKIASAHNALIHGLAAPQTKPETDLVHQLAAAQWRLARYAGKSASVKTSKACPSVITRLAVAFDALVRDGGSLALLNRYQARLQSEYHRILKALMQMQSARAKQSGLPNERQQYT